MFPTGARVIYPNFTHAKAGASMDFWHYDPAGKGWFIYGKGTVTPDGKRVVPDKGTEVYQFTGAMLITPGEDPPPEAQPQPGGGARGGDPVDLGVTTRTYENGRLKTLQDARGTVYLTNEYDANGRVHRQTMPGGDTTPSTTRPTRRTRSPRPR